MYLKHFFVAFTLSLLLPEMQAHVVQFTTKLQHPLHSWLAATTQLTAH
jgi:hypothetical protein